jgi:hypothetical protein
MGESSIQTTCSVCRSLRCQAGTVWEGSAVTFAPARQRQRFWGPKRVAGSASMCEDCGAISLKGDVAQLERVLKG